uniref:TOG domain-containing protein n=1 Tax=Caenorhabditis japonica TaxID=281687 RepID=A0A8R1HWX1_CAEJA
MSDEEVSNVENEAVVEEKNENLSEEDALKEEIRRFSAAVSNPSVRVHGMSYTSLTKLVERAAQEIPAQFVKGLVKMSVSNSIRLYGQPKSFQYVSRLLHALAKRDFSSTLKSLQQTIISSLGIISNLSESRAISQVPTAKWLLALLSGNSAENTSETFSALATISYWMAGSRKAWKIFVRKLAAVLSSNSNLLKLIEKEAGAIGKESPEKVLALLSAVASARKSAVSPAVFVDLLTKSVLLAKTRPPQFLVDRISSEFIPHLSEKDFNDNLLPNIKKALLRSPEAAIFGIQGIVENVNFSLDTSAQDLLKSTTASLQNADENIREAAIAIAVFLTKKAQGAVITRVVNTLYDQFSAAKTPENRISLLQGVARIAKVSENQDLDKIAADVIAKTAKADKDSHDGTVEAQWHTAAEWAARLNDTSASLTVAFKEAAKLQPAVKYIAYRNLYSIFEKKELTLLPSGTDAKPLLAELEVAPKGELSSIGLALLLLRTSKPGSIEHTKAWSRASHAESVFKDKFLSATKWQEAVAWARLAELVILQRPVASKSAPPSYSPFALKSLSILLFWPHWQVRQQASKSLLNILAVEKALFAEALADLIFTETANGNIDSMLRRAPGSPPCADWKVPGEWYVSTLKLLLTPKEPELDKLAIHTLLLASIQRLVEVDGSVWLRWVHEHRESKTWQASEVFRENAIQRVLNCEHRSVRNTALITLVALHDESLRADLWKHVETNITELAVADYTRVTENEISVYKCPEGQLFNTAVLEFDEAAGIKTQKGASIQDQLAEIQLIRELAEKRRKEGKLTAKQKQVMDKELANEKETRDALTALFKTAEAKLDETRAMVIADPQGAFYRAQILFDYCLPLTRSLLVAEQAARLFLAYRDACFEHSDDYLEELVGSNWLRVIGAHHKITGWHDESLHTALKRMFSLLNERAFVIDSGDDADDDGILFDDEIVGANHLTLLFPMISIILKNQRFPEPTKNDALQLLQSAIHKKFLKDRDVLHLPMEHYASMLFEHYSQNASASAAFKAVQQLFRLANDTNDIGDRVLGMVAEILAYLTHDDHAVRVAALEILSAPQMLMRIVVECGLEAPIARKILVRVFVARQDPLEQVAEVAERLWLDNHLHVKTCIGEELVEECVSASALVRKSAGLAIASYIEEYPDEMKSVLNKFADLYKNLVLIREPIYDDVGRLQREAVDEWERRSGVGDSLVLLSALVRAEEAEQLIHLVAPDGLGDRSQECRNELRNAAVETIRRHGATVMGRLLPYLENLSDKTPSTADHDNRRQGLVVLLGTLAQYIDSTEKVKGIVARLVEALSTPSQTVQESVSRCLAPLVPKIRQDAKDLVSKLQFTLFEGETYGERRGAAYGIAGLLKGLGTLQLKELELLTSVQKNMEDKKSPKHREGGLLALEILCSTIGKLFEPYILKALPALLITFGDNDANVRQSAEDTARAMMAAMTVYGTKLVLPLLLIAIDDDSWRTKCAATELLGSMAFCAPRQLSSCLPNIVPKLIEILADSSSKVQKSGEKALQQIARVVRNPEILGVTNQLMAGLLDPANKTSAALQAVLNTKFIHYIDAPSLALMMPIVRRAFEDRNSETRRVAAQIISNIYSLTENKDMEPYLPHMVPGLQRSLLDPVPEIRSVSARALGAVVSKSGGATSEKLRGEVIPWLKEKLISPQSTVDRSGAAQGLCEVLAGAGTDQLEYVMPEIIHATESTDVSAETRDGYILMYIYLPMVFGDRFVPYLPQVVPPILKALADENEYVRASALKAGQRLISQYCSHARKLLLPQLQLALMDENWRIRYAAVQLIGDFLFNISGISGKSTSSTADEDDTMGMEQAGKVIVRALGQKDRDRVLAGLYLTRSDVALVVRQAAGHVWKMVVANTPRTLREVTKVLFEMVVDSLASTCEERQQMGARCLGELVRKMGDKVINEILPVLDVNQRSDEIAKRVGVAIALHEIIGNMSKEVTNHYLSAIVNPVRLAICDESELVREAAADTFTVLYHVVGNEALDEIICPLLEQLSPEQDQILAGLCDVMRQNSRSMLPYLLPKLTKPPVNVHALCSLAAVSGDSLSRQLPKVLDALLASCETNDENDPMIESCEKVVIAVTDEDGVPVLVDYLLQRAAQDDNVPAAVLLNTFIAKSGVSLAEMAETVLPGLINLYTSPNPQIVDHIVGAAVALTQSMDQRELLSVLPAVKKAINIVVAGSKGKPVPGFAHVKSLQPLVTMLRESILQGQVEMKALAAETLGMVVKVSEVAALKPHVVNITGPLIRVLGDRYPPNVKLPIIETLSKLLDKVDAMLRPFLPQLQSTFLKALQEPTSRPVRLAAGGALARLLKLHPKPEATMTELLKLLATSQDQQLIESSLATARALIATCSQKMSQPTIDEIYRVTELIYSPTLENPTELDNSLTACSGALLGETIARKEDWAKAESSVLAGVESAQTAPRVRQALASALQQLCSANADGFWTSEANAAARTAFTAAFTSQDPHVAASSLRAASYVLQANIDRDLLTAVARAFNHTSIDVRKTAATAIGHVGQQQELSNDVLKLMVPQLVNGCKESNSAVRCASELALVHALKMAKDEERFENYRNTLEGVVQRNIDEVRVSLARAVRAGDIDLEVLDTVLTVF